MPDNPRVGVLGGSFNPIHNAHLAIARAAMRAMDLREVLFLPTGNPPHKHSGLADKFDRLRMVELAVEGQTGFAACDMEVRREGVIYTVDTLHAMLAQRPGMEIWYIIGADTLLELHTWRNPDEVFTLCGFIVCARPGWNEEAVNQCAKELRARGANLRFVDAPEMDISATMIRAYARQGEIPEGLVPPTVACYIRQHRLYTDSADGGQPSL